MLNKVRKTSWRKTQLWGLYKTQGGSVTKLWWFGFQSFVLAKSVKPSKTKILA